jgi:hypothetical protein
MQMGPEALMVQYRTAPRAVAADLARDYDYEDIRVVAADRRNDPEWADETSGAGGLVLRAQAWLRRRGALAVEEPEAIPAEGIALAALPARAPGVGSRGVPARVWALPLFAMDGEENAPTAPP